MKRYKLNLTMSTEQLEYSEIEKAYVGYDHDTYQDHGLILEKTYNSLEKLIDDLKQYCERLSDIEIYTDNDEATRLEWSCEGENDYKTPEKEQIPFVENYSAFIETLEISDTPSAELEAALKQSMFKGALK